MKEKFTTLTSTCVPLPIENIDTDQIIPARFLKATSREGFGENLFHDWRFNRDGSKTEFVLNNPDFSGKILVAGKNFGCGSSREHAAWAIHDYGFRAVISSFFADIHKNNELNSFVLPVTVSQGFLDTLLERIQANPQTLVTIDLENQTVSCPEINISESFSINPYKKTCLQKGIDDVEYLLENKELIEKFEKSRDKQ